MTRLKSMPYAMLLVLTALLPQSPAAGTEFDVVESWDFTDPAVLAAEGWRITGGNAGGADDGGFLIDQRRNGPVLRNTSLRFRALDASACAVRLKVTRDGETVTPPSVRLYWARAADVGRGNSWPFEGGRSVALDPVPGEEGLYRGDVGTHGNWIGTIRDAFLEVHGPKDAVDAGEAWRVQVASVAFLSEQWAPPAAPDTAEAEPFENGAPRRVIFVLLDTLRADHLGYMGYERDTSPFLDALAERSVNFRRTLAHGDGTVYSMPSIFASKFYSQLYVDPPWEAGIPEGNTTIGTLFHEKGFRTIGWTTNPHVSARTGYAPGFDAFHELWPEGVIYSRIEHVIRSIRQTYAESPGREFLYVHLMDIHHPYGPPAPFCDEWAKPYRRDVFRDGSMRAFDGKEAIGLHRYWAESHDVQTPDIQRAVSQYDGEIRYVNAYLAELLGELNYVPEKDLLIVTADHGEQFYEHGFIGHNKSTLLEELHVPLLIRLPGAKPREVDTPVGLADILPTLCDLYGMPVPEGAQGRSLLPALRGEPLDPRPHYAEASPRRGNVGVVIDQDWLYYLNTRANAFTRPWDLWPIRQLLFKLTEDPGCEHNLAAEKTGRLAQMNAILRGINPRFVHATPDALPPRPEAVPLGNASAIGLPPAGGPVTDVAIPFAAPDRQHLLEVDYVLRRGHVRLTGTPDGGGRPFLEYGFYKPRPDQARFGVVVTPGAATGTLRVDASKAEGFVLKAVRCRPIVSPRVPMEPWPGAAQAPTESPELSPEEIQRLEALGYAQ